jgi:hypothetical protein
MAQTTPFPDRIFQVWLYTVGMGRLLLRSTKSPASPTRVDILFQDVRAMKLPTQLDGLVLRSPTAAEVHVIENDTGQLSSAETKIFILQGASYSGYVLAGVMVTHEDEGEYNDASSLLEK